MQALATHVEEVTWEETGQEQPQPMFGMREFLYLTQGTATGEAVSSPGASASSSAMPMQTVYVPLIPVQVPMPRSTSRHRQDWIAMIGKVEIPNEEYIMVDSGASRATCPPTHAPAVPTSATSTPLDIRLADDRPINHYGTKSVTYQVPEAEGMERVDIDWQVAEVSHSILAVSEACDKGHSVLFSPHGSYIVPAPLELPPGTPNVPLVRHQNLFWMRSYPVSATGQGV